MVDKNTPGKPATLQAKPRPALHAQAAKKPASKASVIAGLHKMAERINDGIDATIEFCNNPAMQGATILLSHIISEPEPGKELKLFNYDSTNDLHLVGRWGMVQTPNYKMGTPLQQLGGFVLNYHMRPAHPPGTSTEAIEADLKQRVADEKLLHKTAKFLGEHGIVCEFPDDNKPDLRCMTIDPVQPGFLQNLENAAVAWTLKRQTAEHKVSGKALEELTRKIRASVEKELWGDLAVSQPLP